jgi:hypothetical protein
MQALLERHFAAALAERLAADAPIKRLPMEVARASLDLLTVEGPEARFLYGPAKLDWPDSAPHAELNGAELWLLGTGERLILFAAGDQPRGSIRSALRMPAGTRCSGS